MYLRQLKSYFLLDCKLFMREPMVMFFAFVFPAFMYLVFGYLFKDVSYGGVGYYDQYTASFMGIILLNTALFNIGPGLAIYKEQGFFRRLVLTPLNMSVVYSATTLRSLLLFAGGLLEIILIGWLLFDKVPPLHVTQILLALGVSAFSLFSFGFMFGAFFKTSGAAFGASIVLFQVMLMLSGAGMPLEQFPQTVQDLTNLVLFKHIVDLLRIAWQGQLFTAVAITPMIVSVLAGLVCIAVSMKIFRWAAK